MLDENLDGACATDGTILDVSKGRKCISLPSSGLKYLEF